MVGDEKAVAAAAAAASSSDSLGASNGAAAAAGGGSDASEVVVDDAEDAFDGLTPEQAEALKKKAKAIKLTPELSALVHLKAVHFHSLTEPGACYEMSSFAETKLEKLLKKSGPGAFAAYHERQMARIYPKGVRVDSSNYDPVPAWTAGAQIVALNYQTRDKAMWGWQEALFSGAGRAGIVMKPALLRGDDVAARVDAVFAKDAPVVRVLELTIVDAFSLPADSGGEKIIDPYIKVQIAGVPKDDAKGATKMVSNNGWNPRFGDVFRFELRAPSLSLLLLHVWDKDSGPARSSDDIVGAAGARVDDLAPGLHTLALRTTAGGDFEERSALLVRVRHLAPGEAGEEVAVVEDAGTNAQ